MIQFQLEALDYCRHDYAEFRMYDTFLGTPKQGAVAGG